MCSARDSPCAPRHPAHVTPPPSQTRPPSPPAEAPPEPPRRSAPPKRTKRLTIPGRMEPLPCVAMQAQPLQTPYATGQREPPVATGQRGQRGYTLRANGANGRLALVPYRHDAPWSNESNEVLSAIDTTPLLPHKPCTTSHAAPRPMQQHLDLLLYTVQGAVYGVAAKCNV